MYVCILEFNCSLFIARLIVACFVCMNEHNVELLPIDVEVVDVAVPFGLPARLCQVPHNPKLPLRTRSRFMSLSTVIY